MKTYQYARTTLTTRAHPRRHSTRVMAARHQDPRRNQTLTLPDGRTLGFAEYGSPTGHPLIFLHGYPSSRLEAAGLDATFRRRNLRVVAPDRPGFGLSTPLPGRRITDFPADIHALADYLHMARFALLGGSGGGPYALACARDLPPTMLSRVGLLASAGPWAAAGREGMWRSARVLVFGARYFPTALTLFANWLLGLSRWFVTLGPVTRRLDAWLERIKQMEKKQKGEGRTEEAGDTGKEPARAGEARERLFEIAFEGFAQGTRAAVDEALLLSDDWGFRLEDVSYDKIQMWHGAKDVNSPIRLARFMAERLPHCVLREFDHDDHYSVGTLTRIEEILDDFVPEPNEIPPAASNTA